MMADVNVLKLINDGFGHTASDELIKAVAKCLIQYSPKETIIARWGDDEILLLLTNANDAKVQKISKKTNEQISKKIAN